MSLAAYMLLGVTRGTFVAISMHSNLIKYDHLCLYRIPIGLAVVEEDQGLS